MIYISYDGQVFTKVFNNYLELEEYFQNIIEEKSMFNKNAILDFLETIYIKGLSVSAQVEFFKDLYNYAMEDCISMIDEQGEFI